MRQTPLIYLYASIFLTALGMALHTPLLPIYVREVGGSYVDVGVVGAVFAAPYAFLPIAVGFLSRKVGHLTPYITGVAGCGLSALALLWADSVQAVVATRVLGGVAYAFLWPMAEAMIAEMTDWDMRAAAMGMFSLSWGAAFSIGPAAGGFIAQLLGFKALFALSSVVIAAALVLTVFRVREADGATWATSWRPRLPMRGLVDVYVAIVAYSASMGLVFVLWPAQAHEAGVVTGVVGLVLAIIGLTRLVVFAVAGRLSRLGEEQLVVFALLMLSATLAVFGVVTRLLALLLLALLLGIAFGVLSPMTLTLVSKKIGVGDVGIAMGFAEAMFGLGWVISPLIGGFLLEQFSWSAPYTLFSLLTAAAALPLAHTIISGGKIYRKGGSGQLFR